MATHITSKSEIPDAPFYVCSTDTFMSGWGKAEGLINRLILPCRDYDEALVVEQNAKDRTDQKRVTICSSKPRLTRGKYWQVMEKHDANAWYSPSRPFRTLNDNDKRHHSRQD